MTLKQGDYPGLSRGGSIVFTRNGEAGERERERLTMEESQRTREMAA